jgi:hypothetical protein
MTQETVVEKTAEQQQADDSAAFDSGFGAVRGEAPTETKPEPQAEAPKEEKSPETIEAPKQEAAPDPLAPIKGQLDKMLEGFKTIDQRFASTREARP